MKHKLSARVAAAAMIGALAFTVAACGSDDNSGSSSSGSGGATSTPEAKAKVAAPTEVRLPDGGAVTWTVTVTNTGDTPLYNPVVNDTNCSPMVLQSGDTGDDGIMEVDDVWTYTCEADVTVDTTNTADVIAQDVLGGDVTGNDPADVTTFSSSIDLVKTVDDDLQHRPIAQRGWIHVVERKRASIDQETREPFLPERLDRCARGFRPIVDLQLAEDAGDVILDRLLADEQPVADLLVRFAGGEELENLLLAR